MGNTFRSLGSWTRKCTVTKCTLWQIARARCHRDGQHPEKMSVHARSPFHMTCTLPLRYAPPTRSSLNRVKDVTRGKWIRSHADLRGFFGGRLLRFAGFRARDAGRMTLSLSIEAITRSSTAPLSRMFKSRKSSKWVSLYGRTLESRGNRFGRSHEADGRFRTCFALSVLVPEKVDDKFFTLSSRVQVELNWLRKYFPRQF